MECKDTVVLAQQGDRDSLGVLFQRFYKMSLSVATSISQKHAEDAVQDAFVAVVRKIRTLDKPERFKEWLISAVRNCTYSAMRKDRCRPAVQLASNVDVPENTARDDVPDVFAAVSRIPQLDQEIINDHYVGGLSFKEIAALRKLPKGTVGRRLFYARERLAELLEGKA